MAHVSGSTPRAHALSASAAARSGVGYMARAVPEATIVGVACNGTVAIPRFPRARPDVRVEFFAFDRPAIAPEESPQEYSTRLLAQLRQRAPIGRGPQARRSARRPRPHLVPGAGDYRRARRQGRTGGGARPDRPRGPLASRQPQSTSAKPRLRTPRRARQWFASCHRTDTQCAVRGRRGRAPDRTHIEGRAVGVAEVKPD